MESIIHDECIQNLFYAQEAMKEWIPMTEYEVIFEAVEKVETSEKVYNNEQVAAKSAGFVKKAIDAVITMIKKLYESIRDFILRCTMKGDERDAFELFKEAIAKDPTLKNKKVTVYDFRKISKEYDGLLKEVDQAIRALKSNENHPIDDLVKKATDYIKGVAKATSTIVATDVAIKMADSNVAMARGLSAAIKAEEDIMEDLAKTLGKKDAIKFKKNIDSAAKRTILHRIKVFLFRKKYETLQDCVTSTLRAFGHAGFGDYFGNKKHAKSTKKFLKSDENNYAFKGDGEHGKSSLDYYKDKNSKRDNIISMRNSLKIDRQLLNNEYTKPFAKAALSGGIAVAKDQTVGKLKNKVSTFIADNITDRNRDKRDKKGVYKSPVKFIAGKK